MEEKTVRPDGASRVSRILDELEEARWNYLGEVRQLVDPADTELLEQLAEECKRRLEGSEEGERHDRLARILKKLRTEILLNEWIPVLPAEEFVLRRDEGRDSQRHPGETRWSRRGSAPAAPGFEAYHERVTDWIAHKRLSQNAMAERLGVDPSYLSRAIRGERKNRAILLKIEAFTGIAAPFFGEDDENGEDDSEAGARPPDLPN